MSNPWTTSFHRWDNEAEYAAAITSLGWTDGPPHGVALDVIGTLYEPVVIVVIPDGWTPADPLDPPVALAGYHINAAWMGVEMPAAFAAAQVAPRNPRRVWA
jgi:hypothetical protein